MDTPEKRRWYRPCPAWLVYGSLAVTGLLFLSDRFGWLTWHKGHAVLAAVAVVGVVLLAMLLWWLVALVFRRRFQFGIRTLLVLTVAVALPCSWLAEEMKKAREQSQAVRAIEKLSGSADYDGQSGKNRFSSPNVSTPERTRLQNLLGDDFLHDVVIVDLDYSKYGGEKPVTDAGLVHLRGLTQLKSLSLGGADVTDAGMANVVGLTQLERLTLSETKISDAGLANIAHLAQLDELWLDGTKVTDAGMVHLARLTQLHELWLDNTEITDAGLAHLVGLTQLQVLTLLRTQVTDAGLAHITRLTQLRHLMLAFTHVTDAGLDHLKAMKQLKFLWLSDTAVTDAGLEKLKPLTALERLGLEDTQVTDAGLETLKGMTRLRRLRLEGTKVTNAGVRKLRQALPNCEIDARVEEDREDKALRYLDDRRSDVRLLGAMMLHEVGDKDKSRPILGESLAKDEISGQSKNIVELLLKDGTPASREQVARFFSNKRLPAQDPGWFNHTRGEILRLCADAGMKEPYAYYLKQLDNNEAAYTNPGDKTTVAQVHVGEILGTLRSNDPAVKDIARHHAKYTDRIPDLKRWLQKKMAGR